MDTAIIDFETRSHCDLRNSKCGAWHYSQDPTTEILCLAFRLPHWGAERTEVWVPGDGPTAWEAELREWIEADKLVEAHNAMFERAIWTNIAAPRHGWPSIRPYQWRCSAAKAAAYGLPRALDDALAALRLDIRKDEAGAKVMLKMSKPRASGITPYFDTPELREALYAYCRQDVLAEEALSHALPDLSESETAIYLLDQAINARGFAVDTEAIRTALSLIQRTTELLTTELQRLTHGEVQSATQRARLQAWLTAQGTPLADTTKATVDRLLGHPALPAASRAVLNILRALGRSSTAKYERARGCVDHDCRVRGTMLYHGATTGRWSGSGLQPHNFPRGGPLAKDQDGLWARLKAGGDGLPVMEALSDGLRGIIVAGPGQQLYVADYANIEARVLFWLAHEETGLDIFRRGEDIYLDMAAKIKRDRQMGKAAILGLGYGMGAEKFAATAGITEAEAQTIVDTYRREYSSVRYLWYNQGDAAMAAVLSKTPKNSGATRWEFIEPFLFCTLPSGRRLAYPFPEVAPAVTWWGEVKDQLTCMGQHAITRQWVRTKLYGGLLVENITQAVARDILAEALLRCEASGVYSPVLSVHDEVLCEAPLGAGSTENYVALLTQPPTWAPDLPIAAQGFSATRYCK